MYVNSSLFQSTCPARGTTHQLRDVRKFILISIHVPREGHDQDRRYKLQPVVPISIHVPREGHDGHTQGAAVGGRHFNPRAPRGARHIDGELVAVDAISIHVPREGHDSLPLVSWTDGEQTFQSTCPARGTTTHPYL